MKNHKKKLIINFRKARSLASKITEMIESGEHVPKIMQQNLAVMGLLKSAHQMLLKRHLSNCLESVNLKVEKAKKEILKVVRTR